MTTQTPAKATTRLHGLGQSLWLDNITRGLLTSGTLRRYIDEWSVTGLTSNPTIFDHAIENSHFYDDAIGQKTRDGKSGEALFFELALEDLSEAAALFHPVHDATRGLDGWVSLEVSPLAGARHCQHHQGSGRQLPARPRSSPTSSSRSPALRRDSRRSKRRSSRACRSTSRLLFSREQYLAAAHAYMRGIERRLSAGLDPKVGFRGLDIHQPGSGVTGRGAPG